MSYSFQVDADHPLMDSFQPPTRAVWYDTNHNEIARMDWSTGKFIFMGKTDEAAQIFFEQFLKTYIDQYIESKLKGGQG